METNFHPDFSTRAGTAGGTLLVVVLQICGEELLKTTVLAAVGAVVSFSVSLGLKYVMRRYKRRMSMRKNNEGSNL